MPRNKKTTASRNLEELALLYRIGQTLDHSLDLREVAGPVLEALAEQMGMTRGTLTLLNRQSGQIMIEAAHGLSPEQMKRGRYRLGEGVTGIVVQTGRPMVVPRVSAEPLFLDRTGSRKPLRKPDVSFICVPIKLGNETVGALSADRLFATEVALQEDVRLLSTVASMIAQAVKLRQAVQEEHERLRAENVRLQAQLEKRFQPGNIVGNSTAMQRVYDLIGGVCKTNTTVMLCGESGTGKELVAQAIHFNSLRAKKAFVKINCAALPQTVIESELFGHEKGAFTGAIAQRKGRFELASDGTIFLDEIGDLPAVVQVHLLRVLQEGEFERVGGTETVKVNVRVIAATNKPLEELVGSGKFREDLYYRLNVFPIYLPPLRERRNDILLLANHFLERYAKQNAKDVRRISTPAIDMIMAYHWPGNVRELENCIERAIVLTNDAVVHGHHLPPTLQTAEASGTQIQGRLKELLENYERELLLEALKISRGNRAKAAKALGISERLMGLRVRKYEINCQRFHTST
ncbi:MAG: nif-specific transcriptional activator NifA [Actinobacteria bacterium]|nr:nif-specific transcriptional activator NifA [Actinomycetota bacterium]